MAIIKYSTFGSANPDGSPTVEAVCSKRMASYNTEYMPEIASFIKGLTPEPNHIYVLSNALGGSEVWGANNNGDLFPASPRWGIATPGREWGYETFKHFANVFRQHRNEKSKGDPSYGTIVCSAWNPRMWRVETIAKIRRGQPDIEDVISDLDAGRPVAVSMGCRIPFDECSLCGHRARTQREHCDHLRKMLKTIMPDGTIVGMINYYPIFFDQSFVRKGADPSAWAHRKVAEGPIEVSASKVASLWQGDEAEAFTKAAAAADKEASSRKDAAIYKEVPGQAEAQLKAEHGQTIRSYLKEVRPRLRGRETPMPRDLQAKMAASYPMPVIWSTLHLAGIELRPDEYQYMAIKQAGYDHLADTLADQGVVFDDSRVTEADRSKAAAIEISTDHIDPDLFDLVAAGDLMAKRSCWRPYLMLRVADLCTDLGTERGKEAACVGGEAPHHSAAGHPDRAKGYPEVDPHHMGLGLPTADASVPVEGASGTASALALLASTYMLAREQLLAMAPDTLMRWLAADPRAEHMAMTSAAALDRAKAQRATDPDALYISIAPTPPPRPAACGSLYFEAPAVKTADVKAFLGRSLVGVPLAYGAAGYTDAKEYSGIPTGFTEGLVQGNPFVAGVGGALAYGAGKNILDRRRAAAAADASRGVAGAAATSATGQRANSLWSVSKKWLGRGLRKRADLLAVMAVEPALYDVEPAVADRLLVDAVREAHSP